MFGPIRMVALDVDGTLLDPAEQIRPRVRAAVREAIAAGCLVTLATGRRMVSAQAVAAELELALPLILHNGAIVQDSATGAVIYQDPLDPSVARRAIEVVLADRRQAIVYESPAFGGRLFAGPPGLDNAIVREYDERRGPFERVPPEDLPRVLHVLSLATFGEAVGELTATDARLRALEGVSTIRTSWHIFGGVCDVVEVFRAGCSKASALRHVAQAHGIAMDEVMAIGDGVNDCEILSAVGLGVAMGNACPEARAAARLQVGTNKQDGVAEAIERFVLARA